jgi:hypothetical protein
MMNWESVIDTVLNVTVFVFIGLLVWMYLKKDKDSSDSQE